jgi:hypothetical protein
MPKDKPSHRRFKNDPLFDVFRLDGNRFVPFKSLKAANAQTAVRIVRERHPECEDLLRACKAGPVKLTPAQRAYKARNPTR